MREDAHDENVSKEFPISEETQVHLPVVQAQNDDHGIDDDGIFLVWPEGDDADTAEQDLIFGDDDTLDGLDVWEGEAWLSKGGESDPAPHGTAPKEDDTEDGDYIFRGLDEDEEDELPIKKKKKHKERKTRPSLFAQRKEPRRALSEKEILFIRVGLFALVAIMAVGFVFYTFRLQHLQFADLSGYDTKEVFLQSGLKENMFIFNVRAGEIERRLAKQFPYIQDVRVERTLPNTVTLYFEEDCALFYTQLYDEYFVISESMRVLARYDTEDELPKDLRRITLPAVSYAVVGYSLDFFDGSYLDFLKETLAVISEAVIYEHVDELDLSNRYELYFEYDDRLSFSIGNADNLDTKLLFVKSIVEDLESDARGDVTLVDNKMASFTAAGNENKTK